ncbi:MAG: aminotransferase class III-fold pyridoxal phosphate-dependent enzyme, partial [Gammaproteobacteria bacterium]|nr:aminotransferase class III-fold pyridoxal phosphate-dependent enzyme [Gammaproteobacteria bacterium]
MNNKSLLQRREYTLLNGSYYFYETPLHLVRGEGVWLWDAAGKKYLDCYNNVASVGHCHPRVVEALYKQASLLNTNTRYLHENVVIAGEALAEKLPSDLDCVAFVCTGTEANDLAAQLARLATGRQGMIVSEASYHGNSWLVNQLSTDVVPAAERAPFVATIEAPNTYRGSFRQGEHPDPGAAYGGLVDNAVSRLEQDGFGVAGIMIDSSFDSNGVLIPPAGYLSCVTEKVRQAGGLVIMDEVQAGYCRLGEDWWGHVPHGVEADMVSLGKPMGDGHPVAALSISRRLLDRLDSRQAVHYFNTFGGNPVSTIVAKTVIEVIDEEGLMENSRQIGAHLSAGLKEIGERYPQVGNIQGSGLFWGLDMVRDPETREPLGPDDLRQLTASL